MKQIISILFITLICIAAVFAEEYTVGIGDILDVKILKPERSVDRVTISPTGDISVPYIGTVKVKDKTITWIQRHIQRRLARGYLKYPVVTVALIESRSRNYTITGEVVRPGTYQLGENTTVLKAISMAGGFTRFGSKSRVKVLRPRKDSLGYQCIKVDLKAVMEGDARADLVLKKGDIIVVSEGIF